jgi:hypothetical protein
LGISTIVSHGFSDERLLTPKPTDEVALDGGFEEEQVTTHLLIGKVGAELVDELVPCFGELPSGEAVDELASVPVVVAVEHGSPISQRVIATV